MNILMISANYPPLLGGPASTVPYLSKHLVERGFTVYVLTQGFPRCPTFSKTYDKFFVYRCRPVKGSFYYPHVVLQKAFLMGKLGSKLIKKHKIDLIHSHDLNISGLAGWFSNKERRLPSICKFGGDLAWEYFSLIRWRETDPENFLRRGGLKVRLFESLQKIVSHSYTLIAPNSDYQKKWLVEFTKIDPGKIVVLSNAVERIVKRERVRYFERKFGEFGDVIISTACRLVPWKGVDYLIKALKLLSNKVKLVIAGSGPYEAKLRRLTFLTRLKERIKFLGRIPYDEIQAFIKSSNIFVLPSLYEPSALALLDAYAVQTPIVATDVGGTPEIIENGKTGLLVKPRDPEDIAEKVSMILESPRLKKEIQANQKRAIEKYLWRSVVKDYVKVYESLV